MTMRVTFNGATLVVPGAATKIDASAYNMPAAVSRGVQGLIGEAEGGLPYVVKIFNTPQAVKDFYISGDIVDAASWGSTPANDTRVPGGVQQWVCYKTNNSTPSSLVVTRDDENSATFASKVSSSQANLLSVSIYDPNVTPTVRVVTIKSNNSDGKGVVIEASPRLGGTARLSVQYASNAVSCDVTINALAFTTLVANNASHPDNLNISFDPKVCPSIQTLRDLIEAHPSQNYVSEILTTDASRMAPNTLDRTDTAVSINTAAVDFFSKAFDVVNWVNTTSAYVTATRDTGTGGNSFPDGTADYVALTGGSRGGSTTADFSAGLTAISPLRVDQFVPLISEDRTYVDTSVSPSITYNAEFWNNGVVGTVGGIPAAADAHAAYTSSTAGKNERQCWLGADIEGATLAEGRDNFVSFTTGLNSPHTCVFGQTVDLVNATTGNIETYQPWAAAVIASAMRCGSDIAEPLTFKFMRLQGLGQPFDALEHTQDVILGGGCAIQNVPGKGYRIVKCITTYTRLDNDALTEESLVSSWKLIAYDVRTNVEDIYTGTRGLPANVTNMKLTAGDIFNKYVNVALTASTANGATQPPWIINSLTLTRDVADMQATLCLVGGINFELQTLFLVPATITV